MKTPRTNDGFALLAAVIVLGSFAVLATVAHLVGSDRRRLAWSMRESSAALYAAEAGLEAGLARWDPATLDALAPGATLLIAKDRLPGGDAYVVDATRVDAGTAPGGYYVIRSVGRSRGAWPGRRALAMAVRTLPAAPAGADSAGTDEVPAGGAAGQTAEIHLPHPLAQYRSLEILE